MIRFEHRAVPIVLGAVLLEVIGFGIVMPVLPALVTELGDLDLVQATRVAGWLLVVFALGQFVAGPILGALGDRFGRRLVLIASMSAFAVDYALTAFAPNLWWLFAGRLIAGVVGSIMGPAAAVIADVTPPEKRGAAFSLIGAIFGVGFIIGPALGGLVADFGIRAPFVVAGGLALVNVLVMVFLMPETLDPAHRRPFRWRDAHVIGAFRPLLSTGRSAAPLLVGYFLWQLASMVYPATWAFWCAIRLDWDPQAIGWSLAVSGVLMVLVQVGVTGRAIARLGELRTLLIGLVSGAVTFALYGFVTEGWHVYAAFVIGALAGFVYPAINGMLSRMVDASRQGALQGGLGSLTGIAEILGPMMLSPALAEGAARGIPGAAFFLSAAIVVVTLLLVAWAAARGLPPSHGKP